MGVTASGPPYWGDLPLCKCGWKTANECQSRPEHCGLVLGMPEYNQQVDHTPYEFLSESAKEAAVNVVRDMIENNRPAQVGGTHYTDKPIQPWDVVCQETPEEVCGYHCFTVIGYLMRHKSKGGLQDIKKAKSHLEELVRYFEEDEEYPW